MAANLQSCKATWLLFRIQGRFLIHRNDRLDHPVGVISFVASSWNILTKHERLSIVHVNTKNILQSLWYEKHTRKRMFQVGFTLWVFENHLRRKQELFSQNFSMEMP